MKERWEQIHYGQQLVAAILLFIVAQVCLFLLIFGCTWLGVLWWVSQLPRWFP